MATIKNKLAELLARPSGEQSGGRIGNLALRLGDQPSDFSYTDARSVVAPPQGAPILKQIYDDQTVGPQNLGISELEQFSRAGLMPEPYRSDYEERLKPMLLETGGQMDPNVVGYLVDQLMDGLAMGEFHPGVVRPNLTGALEAALRRKIQG